MKTRSPRLWPVFVVITLAGVAAAGSCFANREPAQAPSQVTAARKLIAENKFSEAEEVLAAFVKETPQAPNAWLLLGFARQAQKKWDSAVEALNKAREFPQVKGTALYNLSCIYSQTNKVDLAISTLKEAIAAGFADRQAMKTDPDLVEARKDPRFAALIPPILTGQDLFVEPVTLLHTFDGEAANNQFGWVLAKIGDVDGDKIEDFGTSAMTFNQSRGKVYVYSGKTGSLIFSHAGDEPGTGLGNGMAGLGDVNGDGTPDLGACGPGGSGGKGIALVLSGKDGKVIHTLAGTTVAEYFGSKMAGLGDVNKDGYGDFAVTAMKAKGERAGSGTCMGYSGKDGSLMFTLEGEATGDQFGGGVAGNGDKKHPMLVVGAQDAGEKDRGRVYVYGLETGKPVLKFTVDSGENSTDLGQMFLSFPGDFNKDGVPDLFCSDFNFAVQGQSAGRIYVVSGTDGKELLQITGKPGEGLGTSISVAGDVDKDGVGDLIVGAWQHSSGAKSAGRTYLYSGATGKELAKWTAKQAGDTFGFDAIGIGDVNGDGKIDFAVTSAWSDIKGAQTGRVFVIAGRDYR